MTAPAHCPALLVSAPASGQGKTSVTAAIARAHARRGRHVRVFKAGPDFIDPTILARACGRPVHQLDLFMGGEAHCRALLHEAARTADLVLVEGVMGLFDGAPSSADLAAAFGLPVLAVIDAGAMAQTFGALAHGLATYRRDIAVAGVVANRVGSAGHARMLAEGLPAGLPLVASLPRDAALALPERHLGLLQAMELPGLDAQLDRWADAWEAGGGADFAPAPVVFQAPDTSGLPPGIGQPLAGVRVAVASDRAFSFIYPANLDVLRGLGAEIAAFSPLADAALPACDALWLPGGYPELHAAALSANASMQRSIRTHLAQGKPALAECGGLLYLLDGLTDVDGHRHAMVGTLAGEAAMHKRFAALGLQAVTLPEGELRGHSFHYSSLTTPLAPIARGRNPNGGATAEAVYREGRLTASYIHHYFASNPAATAALFRPGAAPDAPSREAASRTPATAGATVPDVAAAKPPASAAARRFSTAERDSFHELVRARRDMRHFLPGAPVDAAALQRMLAAAHQAPSVGLMQSWRYVRIVEPAIRARIAALVERERLATADALGDRAEDFLRLKVEGVRECGELLVATLAPDDGTVFGRRTMPRDMALCSLACSVENLWLAARAENLGMGWVSMFEPAALGALLGLPAGAQAVGILCLGQVERFYDAPMLEIEHWRQGRPLAGMVFTDRWGATPATSN